MIPTTGQPRLTHGHRVVTTLPAILRTLASSNPLVVASAGRYRDSGLDQLLAGVTPRLFSAFHPNPAIDDVLRGCRTRDEWSPDCVIGLGGGSALDVAKLIRVLPADRTAAAAAVDTLEPTARIPLVLIPTLSGSGSEATRFATVYDGERKLSYDHDDILADHALLDPTLSTGCTPRQRTISAFDALCHAVESYWSRAATPRSLALASAALESIVPSITSTYDVDTMAIGSYLAGRAIDHTRTTAAHGFSYLLTSRFRIPHGLACLLNLRWVFAHNWHTRSRTPDHLPERMRTLARYLALGDDPLHQLADLFTRHGFSPRLRDYGLRTGDLDDVAVAGIRAARTANNPVPISATQATYWLRQAF